MKRVWLFLVAGFAFAHPMGNFSISHYARFDIAGCGVELTYVLDFAEIPTFELAQEWNVDGRGREQLRQRATAEGSRWAGALRFGSAKARHTSTVATVTDGAGGLAVLRVEIKAAIDATAGAITL